MTNGFPFRDELRHRLVDAEQRRAKGRNRFTNKGALRALSVAAALVLIVGGATVALSALAEDSADAGVLSVTKSGDATIVRLLDLQSRPSEIEAELQENDIDVDVVEVPMPSAAAGRFVSLATNVNLQPIDVDNGAYTQFRLLAVDIIEPVELWLGRSAHSEETYAVGVDAFGEFGPMQCSGLLGSRVSDALVRMSSLVRDVELQRFSADRGVQIVSASDVQDDFVGGAIATSNDRVIVQVVAEPRQPGNSDTALFDC